MDFDCKRSPLLSDYDDLNYMGKTACYGTLAYPSSFSLLTVDINSAVVPLPIDSNRIAASSKYTQEHFHYEFLLAEKGVHKYKHVTVKMHLEFSLLRWISAGWFLFVLIDLQKKSHKLT